MTVTPLVATALTLATNLPPVVVEASRLGQTRMEIPAHVETLARDEIDSAAAASTVDLLARRANLQTRSVNGIPALSEIAMRGYGANAHGRVRVLVDGEELNNPDMTVPDLMRVSVRALERVEILHGPQTVLHGGSASAGVINLFTDDDSGEERTVFDVHGGSQGSIGAHASRKGAIDENAAWTYHASCDWDHSDGFRANGWSDTWSLRGGLKRTFSEVGYLRLNAFFADTRYGLPGGIFCTTPGGWKRFSRHHSDDHDSEARNDFWGLNLNGALPLGDDRKLDFALGFRERDSKAWSDYLIHTGSASITYTDTTALGAFDNRFTAGGDLKFDALTARSDSTRNAYRRLASALFAHEEFFPFKRLSVFGGVRWESFRSCDRYSDASRTAHALGIDGEVAGEAGINFRPTDDLKLFARWTRFYHAPLADEMFSLYGVPNLDLKPETGHNTEVGLDWNAPLGFAFNFTAFHAELDDEILYCDYANRNAPSSTCRDGFETSLTWHQDHVGSAGILYSYVDARFADGAFRAAAVPLVPRQQLRVFGEIELADCLACGAGYRFTGRQRHGSDFKGEGGNLPAFGIFDLNVRFKPKWGILNGFTFAFAIDNLFDRRYSDYGEYVASAGGTGSWYVYPAAGRSFTFTVRYEF